MKQEILSFCLVLLCILLAGPSYSQLKGFSFGPYIEAAWPKGDLSVSNGNGIGAGLAADIKLGSKLNLMGSAGFLRFSRKQSEAGSEPLRGVPLRLGLKYKLPIIYLKMESGISKLNNDQGSALILSPGLGVRILGLDIQGSYESWLAGEGRSFASLKLAYHF